MWKACSCRSLHISSFLLLLLLFAFSVQPPTPSPASDPQSLSVSETGEEEVGVVGLGGLQQKQGAEREGGGAAAAVNTDDYDAPTANPGHEPPRLKDAVVGGGLPGAPQINP